MLLFIIKMFEIGSSLIHVNYGSFQYLNYYIFIPLMMLVTYYGYNFFHLRRFSPLDKRALQWQRCEQILKEYKPEPLCPDKINDEANVKYNDEYYSNIIEGKVTLRVKVSGKNCLNMASYNFLNLMGNAQIEDKAIKTIKKYGVGSCGPRGFYGTVDVHLELEERIAAFMNMEEAVVYSYGFSTIASAIPAYCKHHDIIFCDEKISFAAKRGIHAARSKVVYFAHNNAADLEKKALEFLTNKKVVNSKERVFLILEGIYAETGEICDLESMVKIRSTYKMRLFLDESLSIGVLGATGRGIMEYLNIPNSEVDLIIGSLEGIIGSIGGFCVGSHFTIEHQRLSGLGYCFSASLPPLLARAAICAFDYIDEKSSELSAELRRCSTDVHNMLKRVMYMITYGNKLSPVKYLVFKEMKIPATRKHYKMFVQKCKENGLLVVLCPNRNLKEDEDTECRIRICVNVALTTDEINTMHRIISEASVFALTEIHSQESKDQF